MRILVSIYSDLATWNIPERAVERLRRAFPQHAFLHALDAQETVSLIGEADAAFSSMIRADALAAARRLR
jgi:hypothetical protein